MSVIEKILTNGKLYWPAYKHYGTNPYIRVLCDNCRKEGLAAAFGYEGEDICLTCALVYMHTHTPQEPVRPAAAAEEKGVMVDFAHTVPHYEETEAKGVMIDASKVVKIDIGDTCMETSPCQHHVTLTYQDGHTTELQYTSGAHIFDLYHQHALVPDNFTYHHCKEYLTHEYCTSEVHDYIRTHWPKEDGDVSFSAKRKLWG